MASSDSSDDSINPLDEKVPCILRRSSSSSEESAEGSTQGTNFIPGDIIGELESEYPKLMERVKTLYVEDVDKAYFSSSLMKDWGIRRRGSTSVLCDVCIVSRKRPVTLLSFVKDLEIEDEHIKYNSKVARFLISEVRERLYGSFSVISGVINLNSCQSEELFREEIQCLDEEAKLCSVSGWLHMNNDRYECLVKFIDSLISKEFENKRQTNQASTSQSVGTIQNKERSLGVDTLLFQDSVFKTKIESLRASLPRSVCKKRKRRISSETNLKSVKVQRTTRHPFINAIDRNSALKGKAAKKAHRVTTCRTLTRITRTSKK